MAISVFKVPAGVAVYGGFVCKSSMSPVVNNEIIDARAWSRVIIKPMGVRVPIVVDEAVCGSGLHLVHDAFDADLDWNRGLFFHPFSGTPYAIVSVKTEPPITFGVVYNTDDLFAMERVKRCLEKPV